MEYDNNMSGVLFKNDQKGNEKAPWYKGFAEIDGVKLEVAAWVKESKKDGSKFLSLKFTNKEEENGSNRRETPQDDMDNSVPF